MNQSAVRCRANYAATLPIQSRQSLRRPFGIFRLPPTPLRPSGSLLIARGQSGYHPTLLLFALCLTLLLSPTTTFAQPLRHLNPQREVRESAQLPTDGTVIKALASIREILAERRWGEAIDLLRQLTENHPELVVPVVGIPASEHRYVNVVTACNQLLVQLPPEGRQLYRKQVDPVAARWFANWVQTGDEAKLRDILRHAYLSSSGDDALWALAERAWDRGEFSLAKSYWRQLLPPVAAENDAPRPLAYPDPQYPPAAVEARLLAALIMSGDSAAVERGLNQYRDQYPDARGTLAGTEVRWIDSLEQLARQQRSTGRRSPSAPLLAGPTTFGGSPERTWVGPRSLDLGAPIWSTSLPRSRWTPLAADRGPLSHYPLLHRDVVLVVDSQAVRAWKLLTGEPAWPSGDLLDPARIYRTRVEERDRQIPSVGVARYTATIHDGRLYSRLGSPVSCPPNREMHPDHAELVCLDLERSPGRMVWRFVPTDIDVAGSKWRCEGAPLVTGGRVYAILSRRQTQLELACVCLDASTGIMEWLRPLGQIRSALDDQRGRLGSLLLTAGEGRLFLSTDLGVVMALELDEGTIAWAYQYPRTTPSAELLNSHLRTGLVPAVYHNGVVLIAPTDSDQWHALDAATGRPLWQVRARQMIRHSLGVASTSLGPRWIIGADSLYGVDVATGRVEWTVAREAPNERGYGQGMVTGGFVYWPARDFLYIVDAERGELAGLKNVPNLGGNLATAGGILLAAEPDRLTAFGEYGGIIESFTQELSAAPTQPELWLRVAQLRLRFGDLARAATDAEQGLAVADQLWGPQHRSRLDYASRLQAFSRDLRREQLRVAANDERWNTIASIYQVALTATSEPAERIRLARELAILAWRRQQPEAAITAWQTIRDEPAAHQFRFVAHLSTEELARDSVHDPRVVPLLEPEAPGTVRDLTSISCWATAVRELQTLAPGTAHATPPTVEAASTAVSRTSLPNNPEQQTANPVRTGTWWRRAWQSTLPTNARSFASDPPTHPAIAIPSSAPNDQPPKTDAAPPPQPRYLAWNEGELLTILHAETGHPAWSRVISRPIRQLLFTGPTLLVSDGQSLTTFNAATGVSSRPLDFDPHPDTGTNVSEPPLPRTPWEIAIGPLDPSTNLPTLIAFHPQHGVQWRSITEGTALAAYTPPDDQLGHYWAQTSKGVLVHLPRTGKFAALQLDPAAPLQEWSGPAQPLRQSPVLLPDASVLGWVEETRKIAWQHTKPAPLTIAKVATEVRTHVRRRGRENHPPTTATIVAGRVRYQGGASHAFTDPWLFTDEGEWFIVQDGETLLRVDALTGQPLWTVGLADRPLLDPASQACLARRQLIAAADNRVRAINLATGKPLWTRSLEAAPNSPTARSASDVHWSVTDIGGQLLVTPTHATTAVDTVWVLDAQTGRPTQTWRLDQPATQVEVLLHTDDEVVLRAGDQLYAYTRRQPDS